MRHTSFFKSFIFFALHAEDDLLTFRVQFANSLGNKLTISCCKNKSDTILLSLLALVQTVADVGFIFIVDPVKTYLTASNIAHKIKRL